VCAVAAKRLLQTDSLLELFVGRSSAAGGDDSDGHDAAEDSIPTDSQRRDQRLTCVQVSFELKAISMTFAFDPRSSAPFPVFLASLAVDAT
jgi:hypothetical protein